MLGYTRPAEVHSALLDVAARCDAAALPTLKSFGGNAQLGGTDLAVIKALFQSGEWGTGRAATPPMCSAIVQYAETVDNCMWLMEYMSRLVDQRPDRATVVALKKWIMHPSFVPWALLDATKNLETPERVAALSVTTSSQTWRTRGGGAPIYYLPQSVTVINGLRPKEQRTVFNGVVDEVAAGNDSGVNQDITFGRPAGLWPLIPGAAQLNGVGRNVAAAAVAAAAVPTSFGLANCNAAAFDDSVFLSYVLQNSIVALSQGLYMSTITSNPTPLWCNDPNQNLLADFEHPTTAAVRTSLLGVVRYFLGGVAGARHNGTAQALVAALLGGAPGWIFAGAPPIVPAFGRAGGVAACLLIKSYPAGAGLGGRQVDGALQLAVILMLVLVRQFEARFFTRPYLPIAAADVQAVFPVAVFPAALVAVLVPCFNALAIGVRNILASTIVAPDASSPQVVAALQRGAIPTITTTSDLLGSIVRTATTMPLRYGGVDYALPLRLQPFGFAIGSGGGARNMYTCGLRVPITAEDYQAALESGPYAARQCALLAAAVRKTNLIETMLARYWELQQKFAVLLDTGFERNWTPRDIGHIIMTRSLKQCPPGSVPSYFDRSGAYVPNHRAVAKGSKKNRAQARLTSTVDPTRTQCIPIADTR